MASIAKSSGGSVRVFFYDKAGRRKAVHLGRVSDDIAEGVCRRIERILNAQIHGEEPSRNDSEWLAKSGLRKKFVAVGLVEPLLSDAKAEIPTLEAFIRSYIERRASKVKPASVTVWTQVERNLLDLMPKDIRLDKITVGHAKDFHESLKGKGMRNSTISKRIGFCRQFLNDAVDRELIPKNPFASVDAPRPRMKSNTFVNRDIIERIMAKANTRWRVIVALSRYGGLRTPSETLSLKWSHIDWE
ncbi:MAG: tyrosine-type recombinase/integrase, partial [bacterium]